MFFKRRSVNRKVDKKPRLYRMRRSLIDQAKLGSGLVFIGLVLLGLYQIFVNSSYFDLKEVEITGEIKHVDPDMLKKLAQAPYEKSLFAVSLRNISNNVKRHPWINHVQVRRRFPHTLAIHVEEHKKFAVLAASKK